MIRSPKPFLTSFTRKKKTDSSGGLSSRHRLLFIAHCELEDRISLIGARQANIAERRIYENSSHSRNSAPQDAPLAPRTLDPAKAVRSKYDRRMQAGNNVVLIAPDLLDSFSDFRVG
jgi:hypothetical protein